LLFIIVELYNFTALKNTSQELGYDAGFGMNTYAEDVASFIAQEFVKRRG